MTSAHTNPEYPQKQAPDQGATPRSEAAGTGTAGTEAAQAAPMTAATQEAPEQRRDEAAQDQEKRGGGKVLHMHTAHPQIPIPYVTPGDLFTGARSGARAATSLLPAPRKLAYYGLLGGMTAAGVLEWPVALAIGVTTEVITREQGTRARAERGEQGRREATPESSARTTEPSARTAEPSARTTEASRPTHTATG
ncbi:hypothetical protein JIX56_34025 [Streptomyces sp. CA-210063]|uniref:hypothetical protein n=1 Tax=Streptomyces sp. CA-210063 TaxID=2801029 RepID=UPI00214CF0AB|nr:hypothetical protein [Streptomyces sp. CA-210063]UUU34462.1 hypothetical protein JIX56_34025 [Streptomyces sp. CA-210063]